MRVLNFYSSHEIESLTATRPFTPSCSLRPGRSPFECIDIPRQAAVAHAAVALLRLHVAHPPLHVDKEQRHATPVLTRAQVSSLGDTGFRASAAEGGPRSMVPEPPRTGARGLRATAPRRRGGATSRGGSGGHSGDIAWAIAGAKVGGPRLRQARVQAEAGHEDDGDEDADVRAAAHRWGLGRWRRRRRARRRRRWRRRRAPVPEGIRHAHGYHVGFAEGR